MGFWGSIFGGQDKNLDKNIKNFGNIGDFATDLGRSSITSGINFEKGILSGDATKQMQVLAPIISGAKTANQQENKTTAEFGTRSGGTGATVAARNDTLHGKIVDLLGQLTGSTASNLISSGGSLLNTGVETYKAQDEASAQQMANWQNSILGSGLSAAAGFGEGFGLGKI